MLRVTVTIKGVENARRVLSQLSGPQLVAVLQRGLNRATRIIAGDAKERAPYRSGKLRREIRWEESGDDNVAETRIVVPPINGVPYGVYQHEGTGIYGPRGQPIVPVNASVLRFKIPGAIRQTASGKYRRAPSQVVFAKSVRGVPPNPFLLDAVEAARGTGDIARELGEEIRAAKLGTHGEDAGAE